jgi:ABC-type transport system involved in multi-copper enzyme maturation permease subunit
MFKKELRKKSKEERKESFFKTEYVFILCSLFFSLTSNAQCAMCRAALAGDANVEKAKAVNDGIVFLMVVPYLLIAIIGYFVYQMRKNKTK